jgi:methionine synthase I (cobalamin-dependent)
MMLPAPGSGEINVLGGCCGTDHRHIEQIGLACRAIAPQS